MLVLIVPQYLVRSTRNPRTYGMPMKIIIITIIRLCKESRTGGITKMRYAKSTQAYQEHFP